MDKQSLANEIKAKLEDRVLDLTIGDMVTIELAEKDLVSVCNKLRDDEATMRKILAEFQLNPETGRIINGHVPVRVKRGQRPILANGKLLVIDGGMAKAYQAVTGIAG